MTKKLCNTLRPPHHSIDQMLKIYFFCSKVNLVVVEESNLYEDILLENFQESYNNLTVKSLLMIKFAQQGYVRSDFIFKVSHLC